jgi:signal transduction histidine kinase/CheY-like chemotaxis protein
MLPAGSLRRPVALTWVTAGLFLAAVAVATVWLLNNGRTEALARTDERVRQVVSGAEADFNRTLMSADLVLAGLVEVLGPAIGPRDELDAREANRILAALNDRQLILADVAVLAEDGRTLAAGLPASGRAGLSLPPGLREQVLSLAIPALVVSEPVIGTYSGERSLLLARALRLPAGRRVIGVAEVPTALLASVVATAVTTEGLMVTLERDDGLLLTSLPPDDTRIGRRLTVPLTRAQADGLSRLARGRLVELPSRVAVRSTLFPQLLMSAGVPVEVALTDWRQDRDGILVVALVFALFVLAAAALAHWQVLRLDQARQALARSAATLDQALASMGDAFLLCDSQDRVLHWNQRYVELFPWLGTVLAVGVPFRELAVAAAQRLFPDDREAEREAWIRMRVDLHRAADHVWEQMLVTGVAVNAVERRTPDGGVVSVYRDISTAEHRLSRAKLAAEAANEAKSQFLANMSHEIRTPLNAVLGLNELLLQSELTAQQRRHAELVRSSGQLLLSLINDILDLSRIEAGHLDLQEAPFAPRRVAEEVLALLDERAVAQRLPLTLEVADAVAPELVGDGVRVRQVLFNLVGNALKFTQHGSVRVRLDQTPCDDGSSDVMLSVQVVDTGIGIEASVISTLFDRFTQADSSAARRHGGSGLGLAITREVVDRMGGHVEVRSEPGAGSCFTATMRCAVPVDAPRSASGATAVGATPAGPPPGLRVLAAEDNVVNQLLIEAVLERMGHRCELVPNGRLALQQVQDHPWDLVLMDMQMPELDGLDATRAIRALPGAAGRVPIVAMTANARDEDRRACLEAGMDDFVSKPIDLAALQAAMARALTARQHGAVVPPA